MVVVKGVAENCQLDAVPSPLFKSNPFSVTHLDQLDTRVARLASVLAVAEVTEPGRDGWVPDLCGRAKRRSRRW